MILDETPIQYRATEYRLDLENQWITNMVREGSIDLFWAHRYAERAMMAHYNPHVIWFTLEEVKARSTKETNSWVRILEDERPLFRELGIKMLKDGQKLFSDLLWPYDLDFSRNFDYANRAMNKPLDTDN